jgi:hypothetical protein
VRAVGYTCGDTSLASRAEVGPCEDECYPDEAMKTRGSLLELIFLVEEAPEGGVTARALGESIFTEADGIANLYDKVRDAVRCHFEEGEVPKVIRLHFVREEVITVEAAAGCLRR